MDKIIKRNVAVEGVSLLTTNDNVATANLTIGPRYHKCIAQVVATAAANKILTVADMMGLINIKIGGKPQRQHTATELDRVYQCYGEDYRVRLYNYDAGHVWFVGANYTGGAGLATQRIVGAGNNDLTVTPAITNGVITALAVVAGGTAYKVGDTFSITDSTGTGAYGTVLTVNAGAVLTCSVTNPSSLVLQGPVAGKQTIAFIPMHFTEPWRQSYASRQQFSWPTAWENGFALPSFQIEFTIPKATANINSGQPYTLILWSETDSQLGLAPNGKPVQNIVRWSRLNMPYAGAGDNYFYDPSPTDIELERTFFCQPGDDISNIIVSVDSRIVRDCSKDINDQTLIENGWNRNSLDPDIFTLCFDYSDLPTDGLALGVNGVSVKEYFIKYTLGAAAAASKLIQTVTQRYGPIQ